MTRPNEVWELQDKNTAVPDVHDLGLKSFRAAIGGEDVLADHGRGVAVPVGHVRESAPAVDPDPREIRRQHQQVVGHAPTVPTDARLPGASRSANAQVRTGTAMSWVVATVHDMTGDQQDDHQRQRGADANESAVVAALRAELAAAQHISRWLYDRSPHLRLFLGDVSEWPWLVGGHPESEAVASRLAEADVDRAVLRALAGIQAAGGEAGAEDVAGHLGLAPDQYDGVLRRLIQAGHLSGGQLPSGIHVDAVTHQGMSAAGMIDRDGRPLRVLLTDLAAFTGTGYGTVRIPARVDLEPGQTIALTDVEADVLDAEVLAVAGDRAEVRVFWDSSARRRSS